MDGGDMVSPGNGRRVQVRKVREGGFTEEKRQIVLDHLAACSNLTRAAKAAGISTETVNYHRRRDPAFAQACAEAIEAGYDALEAMAIDHAARGGRYSPGDTEVAGTEGFDPETALHLLRLRRAPIGRRTANGGPRPQRASEAELNAAILAKLEVVERRRIKATNPLPGGDRGDSLVPRDKAKSRLNGRERGSGAGE
jgi:hypothetical protein